MCVYSVSAFEVHPSAAKWGLPARIASPLTKNRFAPSPNLSGSSWPRDRILISKWLPNYPKKIPKWPLNTVWDHALGSYIYIFIIYKYKFFVWLLLTIIPRCGSRLNIWIYTSQAHLILQVFGQVFHKLNVVRSGGPILNSNMYNVWFRRFYFW